MARQPIAAGGVLPAASQQPPAVRCFTARLQLHGQRSMRGVRMNTLGWSDFKSAWFAPPRHKRPSPGSVNLYNSAVSTGAVSRASA